jgi:hypothetical protein
LLFIVLGRLARNAIQTSNAAAAVKIDGEAEGKNVQSKMVA